MGDDMKECRAECYIAKKDDTDVSFENYFFDKESYNEWAVKTEERALSEFYNKKIKIVPSNS